MVPRNAALAANPVSAQSAGRTTSGVLEGSLPDVPSVAAMGHPLARQICEHDGHTVVSLR
jgi:hypothetical protein